jgi:hypothetical protein
MKDEEIILIGGIALLTLGAGGLADLGSGVSNVVGSTGQVLNSAGNILHTTSAITDDVGTFLKWFPEVISQGIDKANNDLHNNWVFF